MEIKIVFTSDCPQGTYRTGDIGEIIAFVSSEGGPLAIVTCGSSIVYSRLNHLKLNKREPVYEIERLLGRG